MSFDQESPKENSELDTEGWTGVIPTKSSPEKNSKLDTEGWTEVIPTKSSSFRTEVSSRVYWWVKSTATYSKYQCHDVDSTLVKHSNPFIYLSEDNEDEDNNEAPTVESAPVSTLSEDNKDEDNNEAPTAESTPVSTTSDEINNNIIIGMNGHTYNIILVQLWINNSNFLTYHNIIALQLILLLLH